MSSFVVSYALFLLGWWCLLGIRRVVIISSTVEAGKKEGDAEKLTGCGGNNLLKLVRESAGA